jgi:hypothetical protein
VTNSPFTESEKDGAKAFTVRGEFVLGAEDSLVIDGAPQDPGLFELAQLFGEDFMGCLGNASPKLPEAKFAVLKLIEDEGLPLASDDAECG